MDPVDRLLSIEAIKRLKARYLRLVNLKQWDEWLDTMTEDCEMILGARPQDTLKGREAIFAALRTALAHEDAFHQCHNPEIEVISEADARGVWSLHGGLVSTPESQPLHESFAYYEDEYRRGADGAWRVSRMVLKPWIRIVHDERAKPLGEGPSRDG
ncbi:MAG: nuclear transport factor 2 family protein [Caulobacteraceae bacterium]|nr:nuclear transport factor 2 family protein [Caulobacteraceae bacterium]